LYVNIQIVIANGVKQSRVARPVIANPKGEAIRNCVGKPGLLHSVRNDRKENPYSDKVPLVAQTTQHISSLIPLFRGVTFIK
ncbi:MAG: hypothetical protein LBB84_11100, partial [Tannerellaceae bacterium]|nr:hypothetical protein [Tannerellaceae bacterium]